MERRISGDKRAERLGRGVAVAVLEQGEAKRIARLGRGRVEYDGTAEHVDGAFGVARFSQRDPELQRERGY
jgi:hypothetical protein